MTAVSEARPSTRAVLGALAALAALRVCHWLAAPPNSDEAYYWLWGRHPALSYLDHPPLHAWLQGAVHALLGTSLFSLRLGPALTSLASGWVIWRLARRIDPAPATGPAALLAFFSAPLLLMLTGFAWQDHLLILGWLLCAWLALEFLLEVQRGERGRTGLLLGAGLALGLAGLAKYSAVLLAVALLVVVALDRRLRHLLRDPRLWIAGGLALLVVSPVLWWNAQRGGTSFRFHLVERLAGGGVVRLNPLGPLRFLLPLLLSAGPFALAAALWPRALPAAGSFAALHRRLALTALLVSTGLFLAISTVGTAIYYWDVVGLLLLYPAAAASGRPRWLAAHAGFGLLAALLMTAHATLLPLTVLLPGVQDDDSRMTWGFDELAVAVEAARVDHPEALVGASDYRSASSLAFALDRDDLLAIAQRRSQFDEWTGPAQAGRDVILAVEDRQPMTPWLAGHFAAVRPLAEVEARRFGVPVKRYQLWLGSALRPPAPKP